ncbi:MAG: PDZ domain-containing protein [Deltaproteobacteria bacterium]|nr:PDZ domain-containing protein [Deltaproteobacteria bacterium]
MSTASIDPTSIGSALADAIARVAPSVLHVTANDRIASGVVWSSAEGLVVTSSRLFHEQRDATITIDAGHGARRATLVGIDEATELALVRLDAAGEGALIDATWLDDGARVGLFVAPVARTTSGVRTTFGVLTRVGPAWVTARGGTVDAFLDVDGTLPPGFSGGPLVDVGGRVLGVNTRGLVPGGATLPTPTVRRVVGLIAAGTSTTPGHLGVGIQSVDLPEHLRVDPAVARGLLVTGVVPGSAAERAGLAAGDVIVAIDGRPIPDHAHLLAALAGKVGATVKIRVARHGQAIDVEATPGAREERRRRGPPIAQAWRGFWGKGCR